jgi:polysaccharide pyruvyl transferase WcaK-like protein
VNVRRRGEGPGGEPAASVQIALWGNFGALNLGNECTLAAAIANLRARLPHATLICVCSRPADVATRHGVAAIPIGCGADDENPHGAKPQRLVRRLWAELADWIRALRAMRGVSALLVTGTGILTDHGEGTLGFPYQLFKWCAATRLRGGKVLYVSVGAESISQPLARLFLRNALRMADYRSYRDAHSMAVLRRNGMRTEGDPIFPDLAFSLALPAPDPEAARGARSAPIVAVGLYNYRVPGPGDAEARAAYEGYLDKICGLIGWLQARGCTVRVIVGDLAYDAAVRSDLRALLQRRGASLSADVFADAPAASWQQLLGQLEPVDFVIASRFHNLVLGLMLGKPAISLSYEPKNEALMQQMGLSEYCQTLDGLDLEQLTAQFVRLEQSTDSLRAAIAAQVLVNRDRLGQQYHLIAVAVSPM